ncbi:MAG: glycosyltransferase, family 2, partial [Clostridia bacterium]|nr:glycosyltransferase, family 2 [Clostridia bacterium]
NIEETINALKKIDRVTEIIAVNDGSTDNTLEVLKGIKKIIIINSEINRGKGYAVKLALPYVTNKYVLLVDADLKGSAIEMQKLVENPKFNDEAMLVAVYPKPLKKGGFGLVKSLSRNSLYLLTSQTSDSVLSGQRLIPLHFMKDISLPDNFGMEFKITLEALRNNINIVDIPLDIRHRETGRNISGFCHRGKQFINILKVVVRELV